jgi:hypothetical protein
MEQLAADVADQSGQLTRVLEQFSLGIQLLNALRESAQQRLEISSAVVVVGLVRHAMKAREGTREGRGV